MSVMIGGFTIDVAVRESHQFPSEVTRLPVETGTDITDHIRNRPVVVTLDGIVSDTPIGAVAGLRPPDSLPSDDAYSTMLEIRDAREPVTITTSLATYENMALQNLVVPRRSDTGDALRFQATFTQIQLVTNERTTIRTTEPRGRKKVRRGSKPSKSEAEPDVPPTPPKTARNASLLWRAARSVF